MTPDEYNDRLFYLIRGCAPEYGIPAEKADEKAAQMVGWCKALMDAYIPLRRNIETLPPIAEQARRIMQEPFAGARYVPQSAIVTGPHIGCATEGCLNICLTTEPSEARAMGWGEANTQPRTFYCHDCAADKFRKQQAIAESVPPLVSRDGDGLKIEDVLEVFKVELKEFLERAESTALAESDKTLFAYMKTCIEPPLTPAEHKQLDF